MIAKALLAALIAVATAAAAPPPPSPVTLVSTPGAVAAFAQDSDRLAWVGGGGPGCPLVRLRRVSDGTTRTLGGTFGGDGCYGVAAFALGGAEVVWGGFVDCCNHGYGAVTSVAVGRRPRNVHALSQPYWSWGDFLTGASGDGGALVFSTVEIQLSEGKEIDEERGFIHCLPVDPCTWDVTGGGVWRVVGGRTARIVTDPAFAVAASSGRVAVAAASRARSPGPCSNQKLTGCPDPRPAADGAVSVVSAATGALVSSFEAGGRVAAIAAQWPDVAVLVRSSGRAAFELYDGRMGRRRLRSPVSTAAGSLSLGDGGAVYSVGRAIYAVSTRTGRSARLAVAASVPVGLSVEGRRVAWAERAGSGGRIRSTSLPRT